MFKEKKHLKPRRGLLWLYIVLLIAAVAGMIILARCSTQGEDVSSDASHSRDTLRVAMVYAPMNYYVEGDSLGGLGYDLLRKFSREKGRPVKFIPVVNLEEALVNLKKGRFSLLASLPVTYSMSQDFAFSEPLYLDRQILVQRQLKNGKIGAESALDLAGDTVNITSSSPARSRLAHLSEEIGETITVQQHPDLSEEYLVMKVASGDLKYAVVNEKTAQRVKEELKADHLVLTTPISFTQFQSWVVPHSDSALLREINDWIVREKVFQQNAGN